MRSLAARNGGRAGLAALAAILLIGLGLRVDYAWEGRSPVYDAAAYARIAANLDRGDGFTVGRPATQPTSNYSPGVPLLVAGLYKLSGGPDQRFARLVLAVIGTLSVLFAYLIGRRLTGPAAGLIGAAAVAVYPALLEYHGMLMSEPLAATLLSGAILALLWAGDKERPGAAWVWLVPGVLLGLLALTRPEYLAVALLLGLVVLFDGLREKGRLPPSGAAILLAGIALAIAPWTLRNAVALERFVPISTGGGQVLFAGTYLPSDGNPEKVGREVLERHPGLTRRLIVEHGLRSPHWVERAQKGERIDVALERLRLEQILAALARQRYPDLETDRALARMGRERLWDDATGHPLDYAGFVGAKVVRIWAHGPRDVMRRMGWEIFHLALVGFGLLGLIVLARRRRWEAIPLATVFIGITAISAILVASPRRVLVMLPLVAALAGVGLAWLWGLAEQRRRARARIA